MIIAGEIHSEKEGEEIINIAKIFAVGQRAQLLSQQVNNGQRKNL